MNGRSAGSEVGCRRICGSMGAQAVVFLLVSCGLGGGGVTPVRTPFNRGVYHYSMGRHEEAIAEYRLALEEDPEDHRARFNLAVTLETLARQRERRGDSLEARRLRSKAEEQYRSILSRRPRDLRAIVNLAAMEREAGERTEARERLRRAIEEFPDVALPRSALAAHLLDDALRAGREGAVERQRELAGKARRLLDAALDRQPASLEANMLLGETHRLLARIARERDAPEEEREHVERGRAALEKALARRPSDIATLLARARLELEAGNAAGARSWFERLLRVDPEHLEAHLALSDLLEESGELEGATLHLWKARRADSERPPRLAPSAYRERLLGLYEQLAEQERERETPAEGAGIMEP